MRFFWPTLYNKNGLAIFSVQGGKQSAHWWEISSPQAYFASPAIYHLAKQHQLQLNSRCCTNCSYKTLSLTLILTLYPSSKLTLTLYPNPNINPNFNANLHLTNPYPNRPRNHISNHMMVSL